MCMPPGVRTNVWRPFSTGLVFRGSRSRPELRVLTLLLKQGRMRPALSDTPGSEHDDEICIDDRREPVRDNDARPLPLR